MKRICFLAVSLIISLNAFCGLPVSTTTRYVDTAYGRCLEISIPLKGSPTKTITSIKFSLFYRNKMYDAYDAMAPSKIEYEEKKVNIAPGQVVTVKLLVYPPSDPNMILWNVSVEQVIYSDGTFKNY